MSAGVAYRKNGTPYTPKYVEALDAQKCIGCGRCFKVCGEGVFHLIDRADLGIEDDEFEDEGAMVMTIKNDGNCVGCSACTRVCPKGCLSCVALAA